VSQEMPPFREGSPREWLKHEQRSRAICPNCGRRVREGTIHEFVNTRQPDGTLTPCKSKPWPPTAPVKPGT
jgi:hypothetical protein